MNSKEKKAQYLNCEHKIVYALLMAAAGMMGAYTFNLRGGVFCNAQTANFVMMSIAFGKKQFAEGFYFLIPISAYFLGTFLSEILPSPVKRLKFLRWDTYLVAFEAVTLFGIGFIPLSAPDHVVQVIINFIASMQYNTFRQAEGVPMATTFCTNHLRQMGIAGARILRKKDFGAASRILLHGSMILCFFLGGSVLTLACEPLKEKAIWVALIPVLAVLCKLVHGDLTVEHQLLERIPSGH